MSVSGFEPVSIDETPGQFHARSFDGVGRSLWVPTLDTKQTLVLGSSQSIDTVDRSALDSLGIEIATRRSGGGAVLVSAADLVWFDIVLPRTDPLWHHDVGRSFDWLGKAVQQALHTLDVPTERHSAPLQHSRWSRRICFAGLGPGELVRDGAKLVGMSQRRTRDACRIQVAILRRWDGEEHASYLKLDNEQERRLAASDLANVATGIPHSPDVILGAVVQQLTNL